MSGLRAFLILLLVLGAAGGAITYLDRAAPAGSARERGGSESQSESQPAPETEPAPAPETDGPSGRTPGAVPVFVEPREPGSSAGLERRWRDLNRRAIEALEGGRLAQAVEDFERCREAAPEEPIFTSNLAEALARLAREVYDGASDDSERLRALELLERALALAPERGDIERRLQQWRRSEQAERSFWRDESEHFELAYDGSREDILHGAHVLTRELERAYLDFGELFGLFPVEAGRPKIRVVLYRREGFSSVTGLGDWAGGAFDGTVRVPVEDLAAQKPVLVRVLRHELVHAFVREVGGKSVPGWLNEGLAQWLESESVSERARAVQRARNKIAGRELFELERLQGSLATWKDTQAIARAYAQSLALVAELEHTYGDRVLFEMIGACGRGETCAQSFRSVTGADLKQVVVELGRR